jgi:hypothetical protein
MAGVWWRQRSLNFEGDRSAKARARVHEFVSYVGGEVVRSAMPAEQGNRRAAPTLAK